MTQINNFDYENNYCLDHRDCLSVTTQTLFEKFRSW